MRTPVPSLLLCGALALVGSCVEPVADLWLLTDLSDSPAFDPVECPYFDYVSGYLDIDAGLGGSLYYEFYCGSQGYYGEAEIKNIRERDAGWYDIDVLFSTGVEWPGTLECTISRRRMTCRHYISEIDRTRVFEFERGDWFDNTPP